MAPCMDLHPLNSSCIRDQGKQTVVVETAAGTLANSDMDARDHYDCFGGWGHIS